MNRPRSVKPAGRSRPAAARPPDEGDRYRSTFEQVAVGILHTTLDGHILEANRSFCRLLGYTLAELRALTTRGLTHPDERGTQTRLRKELIAGRLDQYVGARRYLRKDGTAVWVSRTVTLAHASPGADPYLIMTVEDLTERKRAEEKFDRLERARRVMAECNHAQVHAANEAGLLAEICCIAVESGGYRQAWIGVPTGDSARTVKPVAFAGYDSSAPMRTEVNWAPDGRYQGLAGDALASGELRIVRNILNDPRHTGKRKRAIELGYQSSIALPLKSEGAVVGVLVLHASEPDAFDEDEIALLNGLAEDVAFGIAAQRSQVARQQAEQGLRESEQRVREVFDQAAVGIIRADLNGVLVEVNRKFCEMLGYSRVELLGKSIRDITHPDDYGEGAKVREELQAGAQIAPTSGEKRFQRKDGTSLWTKRTLSAAYDDAGRPKYVTSVIEDITHQKELELRFELTFECAAVGIALGSLEGPYIRVNRRFAEMLGYAPGELVGKSIKDISLPSDFAGRLDVREQLLKGEVETVTGERRYLRKDGRVIWVARTFSLARDASGQPLYFILVADDITGRKELELRYRDTFDQAAVGIVHNSLDGRYIRVNRKFCEMLGYTEEELIGRTADLITHPGDIEQSRANRQLLAQGSETTQSGEKRYVRKDGKVIWVRRTASLARDESGAPMYVIRVIEDITDRKEAEERYRAAFDNAPVGIMHTAVADDRILNVNPKLCEMTGYTRDELCAMQTDDLIPPDFAGVDRAKYRDSMLKGEIGTYSSERKFRRKDGSLFWINRTVSLARNASGEPLYFIRIVEDITGRKELEQRYRESFDQVAVGIVHTSEDGRYLRVNQKFCEMLGYGESELIGRAAAEFTHPEDRDKSREGRQRLWDGKIDKIVEEKRYLRKDGSAFWTNRTVSLARDASGNPLYFIRVIEDITERKSAEERYRATFENAPVGIMHTSLDDYRILRANRKLCEMLGYTREELLTMTSTDVVHPAYHFSDRSRYGEQLLSGDIQSFASERVFVRKDGSSLWVNRTVSLVRDAAGEPEYYIRVIEDISKRKEAEEAVARERSLLRTVVDALPDRIYAKDRDGYFLLQNATNVKAHGASAAEELIGKTVYDVFPPEVAKRVDAEDRVIIESGEPVLNRERASTDGSGNTRWVVASKVPFRDSEGRVIGIVGVNRDITEHKRMEEALRQNVERFENLAHYDVLTGLPNRVLFYDRLKQSLAHARRNHWNVGVMFIDVDRFKNINDTLGHAVGDKLLQQVAERLTRAVRADDTVGRLGGDEFAIVLSNLTSAQDANPVAQKIMASFNEPFKLDSAEVFVTGSIGITLFPEDSTDQDTLIKNADAAMYRAKELGRNSYQFYTPEMNARALELLSMESSLRRALDRGELLLHYQPKANVASGQIVGTEALLRWNHPERGMVPPSAFIPVMEETGLIVAAGEWVLATVCRQLQAWKAAGLATMPVAVNLSARQFLAKDLGPTIKRILEEHRIDPALIELEITESSLMANTAEAIKTLEYLNALGLSVSVDDFGTGYSSLAYLKRFPIDALKIDRSFVRDITTDEDDANITRAIISMAHSLELKVIAEGVETEAQATFLADHGCDQIQGYFLTPALAASDYAAWLAGRGAPGRSLVASDARPAVLLVDDEEIALVLAKRALGKDGYHVHTAKNAHEAFKLLGEHRVDVIVSDHYMPGTSGIEFLARVKSKYPHIVRMMLSGSTDQTTADEAATRAEVFRFLPKGVSDDRLREEVGKALRARATPRGDAAG